MAGALTSPDTPRGDDDTAPIPVVTAEPPRARHAAPRARRGVRWWAGRIGRETGIVVGIALVVFLVLRFFAFDVVHVPSSSMQPSLQPGERVVAAKVSTLSDVERGQIVVYYPPGTWGEGEPPSLVERLLGIVGLAASDNHRIERVIAVAGDQVACCTDDGRLILNGAPLDEPYLAPDVASDQLEFDVVVPAGRMFVMGDDRAQSRDSRSHLDDGDGTVPVDSIVGRAVLIVWPIGDLGVVSVPDSTGAVPPVP